MSCTLNRLITSIFTSYKIILTVNLKMCIYLTFEIINNYTITLKLGSFTIITYSLRKGFENVTFKTKCIGGNTYKK